MRKFKAFNQLKKKLKETGKGKQSSTMKRIHQEAQVKQLTLNLNMWLQQQAPYPQSFE